MGHYITDALGEFFSPSESAIQAMKAAERRRRAKLTWWQRRKEDAHEVIGWTASTTLAVAAVTMLLGPWLVGAWDILKRVF